MNTKLLELKSTFLDKQVQLELARTTLKNEFFGIDKAIDELINNTRSWYVLNSFQNRPLIVNLWGLTGVGKTSLISRLAELLGCADILFKFDLGDKNGANSFKNNIESLYDKDADEPVILVLDEFQHSRTLRGPMRNEIETDHNRKIWELIDSGKIECFNWTHGASSFKRFIVKLKYLLNDDVKVQNGVVVEGVKKYVNEFPDYELRPEGWYETIKIKFIDVDYYDDILKYIGVAYNFVLLQELQDYLLTLNGEDSILFLQDVLKFAKKPQVRNYTKAIIFIIGNLDEAYSMSDNMSADMDADAFHEASLKITVPQIKSALKKRFRNEQIARLGNVHIIYPALSAKAYRTIIKSELEKIKELTQTHLGLELNFDATLSTLIYKEGVFPTQGVRPLLTTINNLVKANLPVFFSELLLHDLNTSKLNFTVESKELVCNYLLENKSIHKKKVAIETPLEDIRISKKDDMQAITAVHESGHALISAILLKVIPDYVYSVCTENDASGFVFSKFPWKYVLKQDVIKRVAMYLGGMVAEELVFGSEHVTTGSSSDVQSATKFLSCMYKSEGLGNHLFYYDLDNGNNYAIHNIDDVELQIKDTIEKGYKLAKETIEAEMQILLVLSDYLSDHSNIKKNDLKRIIQKHKVSKTEFLDGMDDVYYRQHLKKTISDNRNNMSVIFDEVCLNRDKDNG